MTPANHAPEPATLDQVLAVLQEIKDLLATADHLSLFIGHEDGQKLLNVSRSAWFRLTSLPDFPRPVNLPGVGVRYRRADVERWAGKVGTRRRAARKVEAGA